MASPSVIQRSTSQVTSNTMTHAVTLPGSLTVGNTVIIFFACDGNPTVTWPTGWNGAGQEIFDAGEGTVRLAVAWREVDGSEPPNIFVTTSANEQSTHSVLEVSAAEDPDTQAPEISSAAGNTGTDTSPDPDAVTPTGGLKDYLFVAACAVDRNRTVDTPPTGYGNLNTLQGSGANSCTVATAELQKTDTSEDPGVFATSASDGWIACTVAVHPLPPIGQPTMRRWGGVPGMRYSSPSWN